MQDLPRPIYRTYRLDSMLACMLSRMLATLPRVKTLSHMQADHCRVGFEAHISLAPDSFIHRYRYLDVLVYSHRIQNNNPGSYVHTSPSSTESSPCAWRSWVWRPYGMQREPESIDRKNGRSSGSECPGSTQDELKDGKREEGGKKRKKRSEMSLQ